MILLLPSKNERQWTVNYFWHCIIANPEGFAATLTHDQTIVCLSKQNMVVTTLGLCPKHELHRSDNDFWPCIMQNAMAARRHYTTIE